MTDLQIKQIYYPQKSNKMLQTLLCFEIPTKPLLINARLKSLSKQKSSLFP